MRISVVQHWLALVSFECVGSVQVLETGMMGKSNCNEGETANFHIHQCWYIRLLCLITTHVMVCKQ